MLCIAWREISYLQLKLSILVLVDLVVDSLGQVGSNRLGTAGPPTKWPLRVFGQQLIHLRKGSLASLVAHRNQGILEHIGGVCSADHCDRTKVAVFSVLGEPRAGGDNHSAVAADVAHPSVEFVFRAAVGHGMCGHIEKEEVALFGPKNTLVHKTLSQSFTDLLQLVSDLHQVPGFA